MTPDENSELFRKWYRDHKGILVKVADLYSRSPQDRQDLLQEIAVNLWKSAPNFRGDSKESTWIYRVALNTALTWTRHEISYRKQKEAANEERHLKQANRNPGSPKLTWIYAQLGRLDPVDRSLVLLQLDGLNYREIGEIVGISEKNVGVKLSRLRKKLTEQARKDGL